MNDLTIESLCILNYKFLYDYLERNKENFKYFQPHPFTLEYLHNLSTSYEKDCYYLMVFDNKVIGYGMLRGLDNGYEVPTMGVSIDYKFRNNGLATLFINFMEMTCKLNGISKVRIGVMKGNYSVELLYKNLGYTFTEDQIDRKYSVKELE
jgi:ribosomal protein S18 acetylase RimI-like enzyme